MSNESNKTGYSTLPLEKCFSNHYVVPEYQREYVWEESNVEELLQDLISAYYNNSKKSYFMGMMVVYNGDEAKLEIVDGQQRITTFFLMLCAISHIYNDNHDSSGEAYEKAIHNLKLNDDGDAIDTFALELQYSASTDCLSNIFHRLIPDDSQIENESKSNQRLFNAYKTIKKTLSAEFSDFSVLKRFASYIFRKVEFVQIETSDVSDALKIFETINERGVGLNPMDLLKNMVFMNIQKDRFSDLNNEWKKLIGLLEKNNEKPLRFLRYFISATYDITDPKTNTIKGILPEDRIYDWLTANNPQCRYKENPFGFVDLLNRSAEKYIDFLKPQNGIGSEYLKNIPRIAGTQYRLHLVLLLAATKMDSFTLGCFKQIVETIIYYATVCSVKANETEKLFATWCPDIRKVSNLEELKKVVNEVIAPQIDKWKIDYQQKFISLNLNSMQQYRIRYILSRITKYVDDYRSGGKDYANIDLCYDKKYQIEHIMPQTCNDKTAYNVTDEEYAYYVGSIGNLTLLERTYNSSCNNKTYAEKCSAYSSSSFYLTRALPKLENVGLDTAANKLNSELSAWTSWNKQSITERSEMLYRLSEKIWAIENYMNDWHI